MGVRGCRGPGDVGGLCVFAELEGDHRRSRQGWARLKRQNRGVTAASQASQGGSAHREREQCLAWRDDDLPVSVPAASHHSSGRRPCRGDGWKLVDHRGQTLVGCWVRRYDRAAGDVGWVDAYGKVQGASRSSGKGATENPLPRQDSTAIDARQESGRCQGVCGQPCPSEFRPTARVGGNVAARGGGLRTLKATKSPRDRSRSQRSRPCMMFTSRHKRSRCSAVQIPASHRAS